MRHRALAVTLAVLLAAAVVAAGVYFARRGADTGEAVLVSSSATKLGADPLPPPLPQSGWETVHLEQSVGAADSQISVAEVARLWKPMVKAAKENKWRAWGYVLDAETQEVLLDENGTVPHTPASTMKVLTSLVALHSLEHLDTLSTGASLEGNTLYLWGEGDLLLSAGEGTGETIGYAGLEDLAQETASELEGRDVFSVKLVYQDKLFEGEKRPSIWQREQVTEYAGDVGPYAIDAGRTTPEGWDFVSNSSRDVAAAFALQLEAYGVEVTGTKVGNTPASAEPVASVESAPVYEQITLMLRDSDNTLAEQYCHLAAQKVGASTTYSGSTQNLIEQLDLMGVNTEGMVATDCSGLASTSRVSGLTLTDALGVSADPESGAYELLRMLPRGSLDGTLYRRYGEGLGSGNLQAKTGSLGSVSSLAGVVTTQSGRHLMFALGVDKADDWMGYLAQEPIDEFVEGLAQIN